MHKTQLFIVQLIAEGSMKDFPSAAGMPLKFGGLASIHQAMTSMKSRAIRSLPLAALLLAAGLSGAAAQPARRPAPVVPKAVCVVADFRTLSLQAHDPAERAALAQGWLRSNASACSPAQLTTLASNRAAWLGNADSPALMGLIDGLIEAREVRSGTPDRGAAPERAATPEAKDKPGA